MNAIGIEQWNWDDGSGQRVMQRTSVGGTVSSTVYAFGLEEHQYNASGTNTGNTSSYSVGGYPVGEQTGTSTKTTTFLLTDLLGSVLASFSNTSGSAAVQGNRAYSPYGAPLYQQGSVGTSRGFTGQYADSTSGLDDDNARYYDPLVGQFVSADSVQGNLVGMDPYTYVEGNPETWTDPSGLMVDPILGGGGGEGGFGGDGLGGDSGGGEVGSGGGDTTPLTVTVPTADGLTSSLNPDDSVTLVTPEADGTSLEQTFEPGEPGYDQALQQVINQQVGNSPSELTLTEEEDTGPDRAALEAAVRDETSLTQTATPPNTDSSTTVVVSPLETTTESSLNSPRYYFRGTSEGFPGSSSLQRIGVTPASTDPAVATTFATESEQFGPGIVYIATEEDLAGVEITGGNVRAALESEVGVWIQPSEFAERASLSVSASDARAILAGMGIDIPGVIADVDASNDAFVKEFNTLNT